MATHANPRGAATTWVVWRTRDVTCFGFLVDLLFLYNWNRAVPASV